jgi:opacity protein-like surface antigen
MYSYYRPRLLLGLVCISLSSIGIAADDEPLLRRSFDSDMIYLDAIALKIGSSNTMVDTENVNGGVVGISEADDSGLNVNITIFNSDDLTSFKPYLELGRVGFNDRDYYIVGGGVRYDFLAKNERLGLYLKGGAGFILSSWTESPFIQPSAGLAGDDSLMLSLQGGAEYYFADHWAVDLNLRYDIYDLKTTILEASNANASTTWNETGSFSVMVGIVYRFQLGSTKTRFTDSDSDNLNSTSHYLNAPSSVFNDLNKTVSTVSSTYSPHRYGK